MAHCRRVRRLRLLLVAGVGFGLVVAPASAAPHNDDFQNAQLIRVGATIKGTIDGATRQRGEPRHARTLAASSVWYRFRAKRRLGITLSTCGADFDSVLAAYSGRSLRSLRVVKANDNGCGPAGPRGSRIPFIARRGQTYWIAVAGRAARGRFRLRTARAVVPRNDDFADAVPIGLGQSIAGTTENATRERGEPSHDAPGVHTVWFRFSVTTATEVRLDACGDSNPEIAVYTGGQVNMLTRIAAIDDCFVQFAAQPGVTYRVVVVDPGTGFEFELRARAAPAP